MERGNHARKMESGKSSNQKNKRATKSGISIREGNSTAGTNVAPNVARAVRPNPRQPLFKRDTDQYVPITNVVRIMRTALPSDVKIADDTKEAVQECVSEFINFITAEANAICHREYRKTITAQDVLAAMNTLGFNKYAEVLSIYMNKYRAQENSGQSSSSNKPSTRHGASSAQQQSTVEAQIAAPPPPSIVEPRIQAQMVAPFFPMVLSDRLPDSFVQFLQNPERNEFDED